MAVSAPPFITENTVFSTGNAFKASFEEEWTLCFIGVPNKRTGHIVFHYFLECRAGDLFIIRFFEKGIMVYGFN